MPANFNKGTIVLIPFPFTDLEGSKVRPALILNSNLSVDIIAAFISSKTGEAKPFEVSIEPDSGNGLKVKSKVICSKIATLDRKIILGEIGKLSQKHLSEVDMNLKKVFEV
jgi:mRNA interferase MazF